MLEKALNVFVNLVPTLMLLAVVALSFGTRPIEAAPMIAVAAALWGFHFYVTLPIPEPPKTDDARMAKIEADVKEAMKTAQSAQTAAGLRKL